MKYVDMTPIQEKAIPHILDKRDLIGQAETGSGKTSACAIPIVELTEPENRVIQHLILVPTRELALQYVQEIDDVAKHTDVVPFAIFGGFDIGIQKAKLNHGVHILVATPGRLIDLIWNTKLDLTHVRTVILDEADEMLDMGFIDDVDFILSCMLQEVQTLLFSATMPPEIAKLTSKYLTDPVKIELNVDQGAPSSLEHHFLHLHGGDRVDTLLNFLSEEEEVNQVIIFCNSRDKGGDLYRKVHRKFRSCEYIHGGLDQSRRMSIFDRFKERKIKFMVATDVAGRGLDFSHVTHVINFDFPFNPEIYAHRTGRTGRMGRKGIALTMVTDRDLSGLKRLIKVREIEAQWRGREPDLSKVRAGKPRGRPGQASGPQGRRQKHHGPPHHREHHHKEASNKGSSRAG
ncbi:MAG: DEAD/DEAH box helicase [Gemmatimonadetes bacterium]|nr:DEAD/DEAH box helicase [Gemmatimonadota bacterium]MBT6148324.1 DEAD/DEAH box helicase [Gemmatimonadota bacterium]MBT7860159.1 DEAD/DEAH box helicase [Gemmatimonadota bacterium]